MLAIVLLLPKITALFAAAVPFVMPVNSVVNLTCVESEPASFATLNVLESKRRFVFSLKDVVESVPSSRSFF